MLMLLAYSLVLVFHFRPHIVISLSIILGNFLPFLLNDFIFPAEYMSDQFRYVQCSVEIRDALRCSELSPTVVFASYIFAFFPLPMIDSVYSLGVINRFIYLIMIHILLKDYLKNFSLILILSLYTSVLLYSSLALRDNIILIAFVFFSLAIVQEKLARAAVIIVFISFLKPLLSLPALVIFLFCSLPYYWQCQILRMRWCALWLLAIITLYFSFEDIILLGVNAVRLNYFGEDSSSLVLNFVPVSNLLIEIIPGAFRFLLAPTLLEAANPFQLLMAIENVIVFSVAILGFHKNRLSHVSYFSVALLMLAGSILSIVVINEGALTRYVYPLKVAILVMIYQSPKNNEPRGVLVKTDRL